MTTPIHETRRVEPAASEAKTGARLRLLAVTDDALLSHAVAALLERSPHIRAERAASPAETREQLARWTPTAVVSWARHADAAAFEAIEWIREEQEVPVCLVATSVDVGALRHALTRCADRLAVVLRDGEMRPVDLFRVLIQLLARKVVLSPLLLEQLMRDIQSDEQDILSRLTPSELAVLDLVAMGFRNAEIALRLGRSRKLVEKHVGRIFAKLELCNEDSVTDRRVTAVRMYLLATRAGGGVRAAAPARAPEPRRGGLLAVQ